MYTLLFLLYFTCPPCISLSPTLMCSVSNHYCCCSSHYIFKFTKYRKIISTLVLQGGKFFFMEHIREFDDDKHWLRCRIQDILTVSGIWPFLFDGCCLNRELLPSIEAAGFSSVDAQKIYAPTDSFIFQVIKPHLKGVATK